MHLTTEKDVTMSDNPHYTEPVPTEFDHFHLVLLEHGPNRADPQTDAERDQLQQDQLAHLTLLKALYDEGLAIGAGPFTDGSGGLILMRGDKITEDEIHTRLSQDAHINNGRLVVVVRPFVMPKGLM